MVFFGGGVGLWTRLDWSVVGDLVNAIMNLFSHRILIISRLVEGLLASQQLGLFCEVSWLVSPVLSAVVSPQFPPSDQLRVCDPHTVLLRAVQKRQSLWVTDSPNTVTVSGG